MEGFTYGSTAGIYFRNSQQVATNPSQNTEPVSDVSSSSGGAVPAVNQAAQSMKSTWISSLSDQGSTAGITEGIHSWHPYVPQEREASADSKGQ